MAFDLNKVANFSKEKQELAALCVDSYTGDLVNFVADNVKTDARSLDFQIRERFQNDILHGEKFNYRTFRKYKNDLFELIEVIIDETLPKGWSDNEFFNEFVEERRLDLGDKNEFYCEDNGYLTVSKFSGNHWDTVRERFDLGTSFDIPTSWYVVHFYNELERFLKNIDSFSYMIDKVQRSFVQFFQNAIYTAFAGLANYAPSSFIGNGTLSSASEIEALITIAEKVEAANHIKPVFIGTAAALRKIQSKVDDEWIADPAKAQRNEAGLTNFWEGYRLLPIPQVFAAGTFDFVLPTNKIYIMSEGLSNKPIKFVYEGNSRIKETQDERANADQTLEYQIQTKAGVGVIADKHFGVWTIS